MDTQCVETGILLEGFEVCFFFFSFTLGVTISTSHNFSYLLWSGSIPVEPILTYEVNSLMGTEWLEHV